MRLKRRQGDMTHALPDRQHVASQRFGALYCGKRRNNRPVTRHTVEIPHWKPTNNESCCHQHQPPPVSWRWHLLPGLAVSRGPKKGLCPKQLPQGCLRPHPGARVASFQVAAHGGQEAFHLANPVLVQRPERWCLWGLRVWQSRYKSCLPLTLCDLGHMCNLSEPPFPHHIVTMKQEDKSSQEASQATESSPHFLSPQIYII